MDTKGKNMVLYCDGASRGNPGPGAYGFILMEDGEPVVKEGQRLGDVTNNVAEYQGLIQGLKRALEIGTTSLTVKSDSELLVKQLNGIYKVKTPHIRVLFDQAKALIQKFEKIDIVHIRREENSLADEMCNLALDRRL